MVLIGGASAAYAGQLPGPLQTVANRILPGAPGAADATVAAGDETGTPTEGPSTDAAATPTDAATDPGSDPTTDPTADPTKPATDDTPDPKATYEPKPLGAAAYGTCTAYQAGGVATTSTTYLDLAAAAGGADEIDAFCADVIAAKPHPTTKPRKTTPKPRKTKDDVAKDSKPAHPSTAVTPPSDTRHSDTRHSDTPHSDTRHSDTRHSDTPRSDGVTSTHPSTSTAPGTSASSNADGKKK